MLELVYSSQCMFEITDGKLSLEIFDLLFGLLKTVSHRNQFLGYLAL